MTSKAFYTQLAKGVLSERIQAARSGHPDVAEILAKLATDEHPAVRQTVAENPSTPPEILALLTADEEFMVRRAVLKNPSCPGYIKFLADLES